ncbi:MFS transporter [Phycicoccus endophyticus]|uniref:MFS transporter n=1 Tax=Phycicoccus endophyticus TaxID=1690220 RepID=A0A7G9R3U6_9MICO|nr:MFS transporter [Phycicoccus endophyticus]NHI18100.1 MFS transporter [Phycicoccus endophyticus]QNN50271.1 MFS transporter [Phycicoccus endophyticus]GGL26425.1 MFS transporter [Phycicoccus endophyticus]
MSLAPADPHASGAGLRHPSPRVLVPVSALLWGTQFAFLNPAIGIILVALYGADAREVGIALAAYNVSGFVSTLVVPSRADRSGDYLRPLLWCGVFTIALTTALALATTLPLAVLALVALGGPAGIAIGLIFAYQRYTGASVEQIMRTRAVFSFAWVGGPPLAAFLMGFFGNRSVLWAVAGLGLLGLGLTRVMMRAHARSAYADAPPPTGESMGRAVRRPEVLVLLGAFVAFGAALSAAVSAVPLFVTQELGLDIEWGGIALGTCAALEIPVLMVLGRVTARFGPRRVVVAGSSLGLAYYLLMTVTSGPVLLVAGQALNAVFIATMSGVGLTLFQDVVGRPGLASSLFMNTTRVGAVVSGPAIALGGSGGLGYGGVFAVCALLLVLGSGTLVVSGVGRRRRARAR